mmetsp:Transcript_3155/g.6404  ORF Transcript_3155/g.6404 Transcript_3155/m.6404 type:complete len:258 (-) Transcript_3155:332-1105(-)
MASWKTEQLLVVLQKVLLRPDHAPRPHNPHPRHRLPRAPPVLLHDPRRDQRPRPAKAREAMDGHPAWLAGALVVEVCDQLRRRRRAVVEVQVKVLQPPRPHCLCVVRVRLIQPHHCLHIHSLEQGKEVLRRELPWLRLRAVARPAERHKLRANHVCVRRVRVVEQLVLRHVKLLVVQPPSVHSPLQAPETVHQTQVECRSHMRGVPKHAQRRRLDFVEGLRRCFRRPLRHEDEIRSKQEGCVGRHLSVRVAVVNQIA